MIKSSQIWLGSFPEAYEDDIQNWMSENSKNGEETHTINCGEKNFKHTYADDPLYDESLGGNVFSSTDLFFNGGKTVLLKNAQIWDEQYEISGGRGKNKQTQYVWQLIDALNALEEMPEEVNVGIAFFTGADPNEEVMKFMINGQEDVNDYSVFYSDHDQMAEWIQMWLRIRGYDMKTKEAVRVAEHLGIEIGILPILVGALRSYTQINEPGAFVTYNDLKDKLGSFGMNEMWKILNAIEQGNQQEVLEICNRLQDGGTRAQLGSLRMVMAKISNYIKCLDNDNYVPPGMKDGAAYYLRQNGRKLGRSRLARCFEMGVETEKSLKGFGFSLKTTRSCASGIEEPNFINLHLFYSFVAGQFEAASRK